MGQGESFDVIVIGAGPAGVSSAVFLAARGYRILLLDQARFPRDKVCGEFISPAADRILDELGILSAIESLSPVRLQGISISAYENESFSVDYPAFPGTGQSMSSLSVLRTVLDKLLLDRAREKGVRIMEGFKVTNFIFDQGQVTGVEGWDEEKVSFRFNSRVVVDAGGRNAVSLRKLNLIKKDSGNGKIALAAHWSGVNLPQNYCFMHISPPGYTGISSVGKEMANVVLVVDRGLIKGVSDKKEFYAQAVLKNRSRAKLLKNGVVAQKVRAVDSLAYSVRPPECGGLVLVGDAMGFIDPFTGEGIYLSLRSSQIAAGVIDDAFGNNDFSRNHLSVYERNRAKEFNKKFLLSRILQGFIYNRALCGWLVGTLSADPSLAETLVGVIGDYIPADRVVTPGYLFKLLKKSFDWQVSQPSSSKKASQTIP